MREGFFSLVFVLLLRLAECVEPTKTVETRQSMATKGKFFVHTLHSGDYFHQTVPVKWTANVRRRPILPPWMTLVKSKHDAIAYMVGTPVGRVRMVLLHVIAMRLDTFELAEKYITLTLQDDPKYMRATQEVVHLHIKNLDVEDIVADRSGLIGRLEAAAKETFRGRSINPYIYSLKPATEYTNGKPHLYSQRKIGTIVGFGSQRKFYPNIHNLIRGIQTNKKYCSKKNMANVDKHFYPTFDIDWCRTNIEPVTLLRDFAEEEITREFKKQTPVPLEMTALENHTMSNQDHGMVEIGYSFWESILLFPLIAVLCIILILILSIIFFGRREGQQWRDYKTPREQLEEYASVREGQRKLRELSLQRQLLLCSDDRANSMAPSDIHAFLQPKSPRLLGMRDRKTMSEQRNSIDDIPVGKQTVAEAARQVGSSLHLYRNPLDSNSDDDMDKAEKDSLEEDRTEKRI